MPGNRIGALTKPIGVVKGISDVPWHKECSLGRHSYECCSLTVGISVTGAAAESGMLRVVPGTHRALTCGPHLACSRGWTSSRSISPPRQGT